MAQSLFDESTITPPASRGGDAFDLSTVVLPEGEFDLSTAVKPETTYGAAVAAVPRGIQGTLAEGLGGGMRFAGDVVKGMSGYGGLSELGAGIAESGTRWLEESTPKGMTFGQEAVYGGLTSAGVSLSAALAYPLMGLPGVLAAMGATTAGKTYNDSRNANLSPARSMAHSVFEGGVEIATELLPAKALFGTHKHLLARFVNFMSREVPGELVATALQDASAKLSYRPEMTADEFLHDMALTVASVAVSGPVQVGAVHGVGKLAGALPGQVPVTQPPVPTSPGIPEPKPGEVAPAAAPAAQPSVEDMFDVVDRVLPDTSIETVRKIVEAQPPTPDDVAKADAVEDQLKQVADKAKARDEEPDIASSQWIAGHMRTMYPEMNPATLSDPATHPVLFGQHTGKTLGDVTVQPGEVVTAGWASDKLPAAYLERAHKTMQEWVSKYAPTAKVVMTTRDKFNEHTIAQTIFKDGIAFVSPRHFYRTMMERMTPSQEYPEGIHEVAAESQTIYSLSHEFGRILNETSFRTAPTEVKNALVSTWEQLRARVESGEMSAQEFLQRWMNPWKLARGIRTAEADAFIRQQMYGDRSQRDVSNVKAKDFIRKLVDKTDGNTEQVLSFQSFMAEQFARYTYDKKLGESSPLGQWFKQTLENLRNFFDALFESGQLKFTKNITAEEAFTKWLDGMAMGQSAVATQQKKEATAKKKGKKKTDKPATPMEPVAPTVTDPMADVKRLRALAIQLKQDAPQDYAAIMTLIKEGHTIEAQEELNKFFDEDGKPKFEIGDAAEEDAKKKGFDPINRVGLTESEAKDSKTLAHLHGLMKELGGVEYLPTFKTFAGDWELYALWQQRQILLNTIREASGTLYAAKTMMEHRATLKDVEAQMQRMVEKYRSHERSGPPAIARLWDKLATDAYNALGSNARPTISVILDANGFPKRPLHGTATQDHPEGIFKFDRSRLGTGVGGRDTRFGFYFADNPATVDVYSEAAAEPVPIFANEGARQRYGELSARSTRLHGAARDLNKQADLERQRLVQLYPGKEWGDVPMKQRERYNELLDMARQRKELANELQDEANKIPTYQQAPPATYAVFLSTLNPLEHDALGAQYSPGLYMALVEKATRDGNDGIIIYNVFDGGPKTTVYIIPTSEQIKAAYGNVAFSKTDEINFEIGDETEAAMENIVKAIPPDTSVDVASMGEGMRNLARWQLATLQMQQLAKLNPAVPGLTYMNRVNRAYEQLRKTMMGEGLVVARNWQFLMKEARSALDKALQAEYDGEQHWTTLTQTPEGHWIHMPSETLQAKLREQGVDLESRRGKMVAQLFVDTKNMHLTQLQTLERILYDRMVKRYKDRSVLLTKAAQLFNTIKEIRETPFLPQTRFGKYSIVISELQEKGPAKPVHIEYFEHKKARDEAYRKLHGSVLERGNRRITAHNLTDTVGTMPSIPQTFIDQVADLLDLKEEDVLAMQMAAQAVKGKAIFGKYDKEFRKITGASKDLQRNFTDHVWHTANLLAKLKYRPEFNRAITMVSRQIREMHVRNEYTAPLQDLQNWMRIQTEYVLNPQSELQKVRTAITLLALWGNVKTAAMNATSIFNTWSTLISDFGYKDASEEILRAMKDEAMALTKTTQFSAADKELRNRLNVEGVTDQAYAYLLADISNSSALRRGFKQTKLGLFWEQFMMAGMLPFRIVEIYSRRAGALAAARLQIKKGASIDAAYQYAADMVTLTQNDFSPGNRPRFMQGKQSIAFIFLSFVQMMMFLMGGGAGAAAAARLWVLYGMLGGLMGLPGSENMMDLFKFVWRKVLRQSEDPKVELTRFLNEVTGDNAQWLMSGIFHNLGGFDLSRSISLGRPIPGTDVLSSEGDLNFKIANMAADLTGPFGGTVQGLLQFLTSTDPNWTRRAAYSLPGASRNLLQTYLFATEGARAQSGAIIARDRDGTPKELSGYELLGRALGFQPAAITHSREVDRAQREQREYWQGRRASLMRLMWDAKVQDDREAMADVKQLIREYNEKAPSKELRVTTRDLQQSMRQRQLVLEREERDMAPIRRYDPLYQDIEKALRGSP